MNISRELNASCSCKTTSTPTTPHRSTRHSAPAEEARIKARFEFHYAPKHGSWLNIAEIELSVLGRNCLARRIPDRAPLAAEIAAWERERNQSAARIRWHFTTADARIKLFKLYPSFHAG